MSCFRHFSKSVNSSDDDSCILFTVNREMSYHTWISPRVFQSRRKRPKGFCYAFSLHSHRLQTRLLKLIHSNKNLSNKYLHSATMHICILQLLTLTEWELMRKQGCVKPLVVYDLRKAVVVFAFCYLANRRKREAPKGLLPLYYLSLKHLRALIVSDRR